MMLIAKPTVATTGPKFFPTEMNDDNSDDDEEIEEEQNSHCKCTESRCQVTNEIQIKKKSGDIDKIKNVQAIGKWIHDGKHGNNQLHSHDHTTPPRHDQLQLHDHTTRS